MPDEQNLGLSDNDFDLAFEAAAGGVDTSETITTEAVDTSVETETTAATTEAVASSTETVETAASTTETAETAATTTEEVKPAPKADPVAEAAAKVARDAADKVAADKRTAAESEAKRMADEAAAREQFTAEELKDLEDTATNFPEVRRSLEAVQRVAFTKAENQFNKKLAEIAQQFEQRLAPIAQVATTVAGNAHEAAILKAHGDAFTIADKVREWVATQPAIVQPAYAAALANGTASQVIEVLDVYKKAVGAQALPTPLPPKKDPEKEKRLESQEGVRGRNTSGRATVDPDDFDGAFDKFAATA